MTVLSFMGDPTNSKKAFLPQQRRRAMRKSFVFIAFSVLMLLLVSSVVFAGGGGETTGGDDTVVSGDKTVGVDSLEQTAVEVPNGSAIQPFAGLSVNRFVTINVDASGNAVATIYVYAVGEYDEGQMAKERRTWTRVIWTTPIKIKL